MVKRNTKVTLTILLASLVAALVLLVTPLFFVDGLKDGVDAIWGFNAILGLGSGQIISGIAAKYSFTWVLYVAILLFAVMGFTTYYIGPKSRGYYIFSAIVYVVLAVIVFNSKAWVIRETLDSSAIVNRTYLGVGAWVAGLIAALNVILNIVEFRTFKLR